MSIHIIKNLARDTPLKAWLAKAKDATALELKLYYIWLCDSLLIMIRSANHIAVNFQ